MTKYRFISAAFSELREGAVRRPRKRPLDRYVGCGDSYAVPRHRTSSVRWSRQVATYESGNKLPHSTFRGLVLIGLLLNPQFHIAR
jgi:hypothetical protein